MMFYLKKNLQQFGFSWILQIIMPRLGWRWLLVLSSVPCFAALFFYGFAVESPRYLYMKGRIKDVHNILKNMAVLNRTKLPSGLLVSEPTTEHVTEFASVEQVQLLSDGMKDVAFFKTGFSSVLMLFSSKLVKTTLLLWVVYFGNSFSYYGIILLTSELSTGQSKCGMTLHSPDSNNSSVYTDVLITSFAGLLLNNYTIFLWSSILHHAFVILLSLFFSLFIVNEIKHLSWLFTPFQSYPGLACQLLS